MNISQILGMIRYEFILQWRRRAPLVLMLAMSVIPIISSFSTRENIQNLRTLFESQMSAHEINVAVTKSMLPVTWAPIFIVLLVLLPIITADAIPKDRAHGVRELLDSLPITPATYLTGKLTSMWVAMLAGVLASMLVVGLVWFGVIGPFAVGLYLETFILGAASLVVMNAGLTTLLAARQPTRKRAYLVGGAFAIFSLFLLTISIANPDNTLWDILNPARPLLFGYYLLSLMAEGGELIPGVSFTFNEVLLTLAAGVGEIILVWVIILIADYRNEE